MVLRMGPRSTEYGRIHLDREGQAREDPRPHRLRCRSAIWALLGSGPTRPHLCISKHGDTPNHEACTKVLWNRSTSDLHLEVECLPAPPPKRKRPTMALP